MRTRFILSACISHADTLSPQQPGSTLSYLLRTRLAKISLKDGNCSGPLTRNITVVSDLSILCGWGVSSKGPLWVYPQLNTPVIYPVYMYWKANSLLFKGGLQSSEIKYKPFHPCRRSVHQLHPQNRPDTTVTLWETPSPFLLLIFSLSEFG